jgi:hypothetical protein
MSLLDAPAYDVHKAKLQRMALAGVAIAFALLVLLTLAGFLLGHGWLFTDLPAEHKVDNFFNALEAKDYAKAYAIYTNDPDFAQHPAQHQDYTLQRFTEDWTTASPVDAPITSHHVDISKTDGSGNWGTGIIVAVRVNGDHKIFMYYIRKTGELTYPAVHELQY